MSDQAPSVQELRARLAKIRATMDALNESGKAKAVEQARFALALQDECQGLRRRIVDPAMTSLAARVQSKQELQHETLPSGTLETSFECLDATSTSITVVTEIRLLPASRAIELKVHVTRSGIRIFDDHPAVAETEYQAAQQLDALLHRCAETLTPAASS